MSNPPAYQDTQAELDQIESNLTDADKARAQAAVTQELGKAATVKALLDEVQDLSTTTIQIDNDFQKVWLAFGEVDNAGFNFPRKLQPEWGNLKKASRWTQLLWDSRDAATRTHSKLEALNTVVIPTVEQLLDDESGDYVENVARARRVLQNYANGSSPVKDIVVAGDGGGYSQSFRDLQTDLEVFKTTFDNFTKAQQAAVEAQIAGIKGQIASITQEIRNCEATAARLSRALGFTIFGTLVGAGISLIAFGLLGPCIAIKVLIVGAIIAIGQKKALVDCQRRSQGLQDKLALLKKCEALLEAQKSVIGDIAFRIGRFTQIWAELRSNAISVEEKLADATNETDYDAIKGYLALLKATYTPLLDGLKLYATQIDKSGASR
ncbi:unnamed protein product [Rhizoctonia solani]|uniref:Uncharacterized protein n=1 Tax=Rhizoctonia solani TaxID=456999 RepID=A0A8H2XRZ3_9AGAM|nr:unnamed protein product [Rhizoctonia solani]